MSGPQTPSGSRDAMGYRPLASHEDGAAPVAPDAASHDHGPDLGLGFAGLGAAAPPAAGIAAPAPRPRSLSSSPSLPLTNGFVLHSVTGSPERRYPAGAAVPALGSGSRAPQEDARGGRAPSPAAGAPTAASTSSSFSSPESERVAKQQSWHRHGATVSAASSSSSPSTPAAGGASSRSSARSEAAGGPTKVTRRPQRHSHLSASARRKQQYTHAPSLLINSDAPIIEPGSLPDSLVPAPDDFINPVPPVTPLTSKQFLAIIDEVRAAIAEGIHPVRIAQGSSGSYFCKNRLGEVVGVFKPKDEEPYGQLNPKWTKWVHKNLFPCCFGRSCLIPNLGYISEAAASYLDRRLELNVVPRTEIVYLSSTSFYYNAKDTKAYRLHGVPLPEKIGSFQIFLKGFRDATTFFKQGYRHIFDAVPSPTSAADRTAATETTTGTSSRYGDRSTTSYSHTPTQPSSSSSGGPPLPAWSPQMQREFQWGFERLVVLDYLQRNTDRGLDNWMVRVQTGPAEDPRAPLLGDLHDHGNDHMAEGPATSLLGQVDAVSPGSGGGAPDPDELHALVSTAGSVATHDLLPGLTPSHDPAAVVARAESAAHVPAALQDHSVRSILDLSPDGMAAATGLTPAPDLLSDDADPSFRFGACVGATATAATAAAPTSMFRAPAAHASAAASAAPAGRGENGQPQPGPTDARRGAAASRSHVSSSSAAAAAASRVPRGLPQVQIAAIDNGLAFPYKHPDRWRSYPYGWAFLPIARVPFSEETRRQILHLLTSPTWWKETYDGMEALFRLDSDFNETMFRKQKAVLRGEGYNLVEVLQRSRSGDPLTGSPLALVRRPVVAVYEEVLDEDGGDEYDDDVLLTGAPHGRGTRRKRSRRRGRPRGFVARSKRGFHRVRQRFETFTKSQPFFHFC